MPSKSFRDVLREFNKEGGAQAAGSVLGSTIAATTSNSKYNAGQTGSAIGGGIGAAAGAAFGVPMVGQQVGSLIGGLIGGGTDTRHMIEDYETVAKRRYNKLNLSANVNPYGSDNTFYMKKGGMAKRYQHGGAVGPAAGTATGAAAGGAPVDLAGLEDAAGGILQMFSAMLSNTETPAAIDAARQMLPIAKSGIYIKPSKRGTFTTAAKKHGKSVQGFARQVLANKENYSPAMVKKANFARNASKWKREEGGMGGYDMGDEAPQMKMVDIEKGEILIDPINLTVVREYENPNRYEAHADNPMKEPVGNFTMIEEGKVVIPKKYAERFKKGDVLSRKSIVAEILKNQLNEGTPTVGGTPKAQGGYYTEDPLLPIPPGKRQLFPHYPGAGTTLMYPIPGPGNPTVQMPVVKNLTDMPLLTIEDVGFNKGQLNGPVAASQQYNWYNPGNGIAAPAVNQSVATKGAGVNKRLLAKNLLTALPTAYGMGVALGTDPYLRYDENTQFDSAKAYVQGMETTPNIEASKAAIRRTSANRNRFLNNFNSPSTRAEVAANNADVLKVEGELIQNASNLAMDMRNKKRQTLATLEEQQGQSRLNSRMLLMNELRKDKAAKENMVQTALAEASMNYGQSAVDMERIDALNSIAQYYKLDPMSANTLVDQQNFMPMVIDMLGKLNGTVGKTATFAPTTKVEKESRDRVGNLKGTQNIVVSKVQKLNG